jgi:hypothetical protein
MSHHWALFCFAQSAKKTSQTPKGEQAWRSPPSVRSAAIPKVALTPRGGVSMWEIHKDADLASRGQRYQSYS